MLEYLDSQYLPLGGLIISPLERAKRTILEGVGPDEAWIYADRTTRGHRDYRGSRRHYFPDVFAGSREGATDALFLQPPPTRPGHEGV